MVFLNNVLLFLLRGELPLYNGNRSTKLSLYSVTDLEEGDHLPKTFLGRRDKLISVFARSLQHDDSRLSALFTRCEWFRQRMRRKAEQALREPPGRL